MFWLLPMSTPHIHFNAPKSVKCINSKGEFIYKAKTQPGNGTFFFIFSVVSERISSESTDRVVFKDVKGLYLQ